MFNEVFRVYMKTQYPDAAENARCSNTKGDFNILKPCIAVVSQATTHSRSRKKKPKTQSDEKTQKD